MKKTRKCDALCHNAKGKQCQCWCGGRFHGAGNEGTRDQFVKNVRDNKTELPEGVDLFISGDVSLREKVRFFNRGMHDFYQNGLFENEFTSKY